MEQQLGRALWRLLHTYAWLFPAMPSDDCRRHAREWLAEFSRIVGEQSGCSCHDHWQSLLGDTPPDLTSRASFYWWTVAAHNAINRRLNKPEWRP
jgi:FAD-linked sulfhydryl oxidase